jgi:glycosyltransferase involved in cell wall biosynthesis
VSGIPEVVIEGKNGILLNPSVDDLVTVLNNIDNYDWINMGHESRKLFEEYYTFPRMRNDYLNMLDFAIRK